MPRLAVGAGSLFVMNSSQSIQYSGGSVGARVQSAPRLAQVRMRHARLAPRQHRRHVAVRGTSGEHGMEGRMKQERVVTTNPDTGQAMEAFFSVPSASRVYTVSLKKPLGFVLAGESASGSLRDQGVPGGSPPAAHSVPRVSASRCTHISPPTPTP